MLRDGTVEQGVAAAVGVFGASGVEGGEGGFLGDRDERCDRLHRRLKRIVKARGALDLEEAAALREAQSIGIWRRYGYGSLLEYMEMEMGYSPRAALERLRVANAIVDLPQTAAAMEQGDLSFSAARELTRVATKETEGEWLGTAEGRNLRDIEEAVSGRKRGDRPTDPADPALRKKVLRLEVSPEMFALWRQVQQAIEKEKGERIDDSSVVDVLGRTYLGERAERARDVAAYQIAVTVCERCERGWQDGGGVTVEMSSPSVERAMCDALHVGSISDSPSVDGCDVEDEASTSASSGASARGASRRSPSGVTSRASTSKTVSIVDTLESSRSLVGPVAAPKTERATRTIRPSLRRKVKRRDHGRCQVPWCRSSRNCDIHHLWPWAQGGEHTLDNLLTLCEAHHLAHHDGTLSIKRENGKLVFEREGRNNVTRETRAVETASALRGLGYKPDEVTAAIERTRTHVGTADLPLEHWVKVALGYAAQAASDRKGIRR